VAETPPAFSFAFSAHCREGADPARRAGRRPA